MHISLLLGLLLLAAAAVLLYVGHTASQGVGVRIHETLTGRFTNSTNWYFVFAIVAALGGVIALTLRHWA